MGRAPSSDKDELKKGPWTPEEDQKLIEYLNKHGDGRWRTVPKGAGLNRCGKSCRLRWTNYLRPDIKRGKFTFEEEETIIQLHSTLGNKWSAMAARLPGRTDNEIKNYWNTHIRKKLLKMGIDPVTHKPRMDLINLYSILNPSLINSPQVNYQNTLQNSLNSNLINLINSLALTSHCNSLQYFPQNIQMNQDNSNNLHVQNQFQPYFNPLINSCNPPQFNQDPLEQYSPIISTNSSQNSLTNSCQQFPSMEQNLVPFQDFSNGNDIDYSFVKLLSDNQMLQNNKISDNNMKNDFGSSTPSLSISTPLNSSATILNSSGAEDENDSYCSNIMPTITNLLDFDDFLCN